MGRGRRGGGAAGGPAAGGGAPAAPPDGGGWELLRRDAGSGLTLWGAPAPGGGVRLAARRSDEATRWGWVVARAAARAASVSLGLEELLCAAPRPGDAAAGVATLLAWWDPTDEARANILLELPALGAPTTCTGVDLPALRDALRHLPLAARPS